MEAVEAETETCAIAKRAEATIQAISIAQAEQLLLDVSLRPGGEAMETGIRRLCAQCRVGHAIYNGIGLSITNDKLRVFINETLSILSAYQ